MVPTAKGGTKLEKAACDSLVARNELFCPALPERMRSNVWRGTGTSLRTHFNAIEFKSNKEYSPLQTQSVMQILDHIQYPLSDRQLVESILNLPSLLFSTLFPTNG